MNFKKRNIAAIFCGVLVLIIGCGQSNRIQTTPPKFYERGSATYSDTSSIEDLKRIAASSPRATERTEAHLQIASYYLRYQNPERNYDLARENLEIVTSLYSGFGDQERALNWLAAIQEIDSYSRKITLQSNEIASLNKKLSLSKHKNQTLYQSKLKLAGVAEEFKTSNQALKKNNRILKKSNQDLEIKIEKLNTLDRRLEEKRKELK
jgi:hypothetical protein